MLSESLLVSFLDEKANYVIHFFDGQKLIMDMATIHQKNGSEFSYFRDCVLAAQPMISFLKPGESFGLYIDNEDPYFRFKLETGHHGLSRFLLIPSNLPSVPQKLTGKGRLSKIFRGAHPYTSILEINGLNFLEVVNNILAHSYQVDSRVMTSDCSDQSVLITRLPLPVGASSGPIKPLTEFEVELRPVLQQIFKLNLQGEQLIKEALESKGLVFLRSKEVKFSCPCNKESMVGGLINLQGTTVEELFDPGQNHLDIECDYCHKKYQIQKQDLIPLQ